MASQTKFVQIAEQIAVQGGLRKKGQINGIVSPTIPDASPLALRKAGKKKMLGR